MSSDVHVGSGYLAVQGGRTHPPVGRRAAWIFVAALLICAAVASTLIPDQALAATPFSTTKTCGYTGGPSCPETPAVATPYTYGAAGWWVPSPPQVFASEAEFVAWYQSKVVSPVGWCAAPYLGTAVYGSPTYQYGQIQHQYLTVQFDQYIDSPTCTNYGESDYNVVIQSLQWYCPSPSSSIYYQSSPVVGPYCEGPGSPSVAAAKIGPSCPCGGGGSSGNSGAATPSANQTTKAASVNVSNGDVFVTQTDYSGTGADPIQFVRTYNSLPAVNSYLYYSSVTLMPAAVMGVGWSATYFQFLIPATTTDSTGTYNSVQAYRPDGRIITFNEYSGVYSPDGDVPDSLIQISGGGWEYQTADDTIETYNSLGQLVSVAARGKAPLTVNYNSGAVLGDPPVSVSDAFGHSLQFSYTLCNALPCLSSVTDPAGNTISFSYDSHNNLTGVTNADSTTVGYSYGSSPNLHQLASVTDEASNVYSSWTYNGSLLAATAQHAGGVDAYSFSYSEYGSSGSVSVTDPLSQSRTYNQSLIWGAYRMTSSSAACPGCLEDASRSYDANGDVTSRTDFNSNVTNYAYSATTNLETSRTEAYGTSAARTITTAWDTSWRQPDTITEPNRTTAFTYDSMGNTLTWTITDTTVMPNVSRTWTYTYDSYGRMLTAKGPRTDVSSTTTYTYYTCTTGYQCGQLHTVTDPVGNVTTYNTYNAHGQPLTITDPNSVVTTLTYDARTRLTSRQVGSETTGFSYYSTGLLEQVTLPDSSYILYTYDTAHRLTEISDGAGNSIQYTLDAMGNRTAVNTYDPSSTLHRTHSRVYTALNQLYKDVNAAGTSAVTTTYGYDSNGNQTGIAAPVSRTTANAYDPLNRLTQITDPASGVTSFSYDTEDDLIAVQDPLGLTTSYSYNGFGDVTAVASPDTGSTAKTYDSGGNPATSTDARGAISTYSYDASNRVTSIAYKLGSVTDQTLTFGYDSGTYGKGRLTSASDANHSLSWTYDGHGRVTGKGLTVGSVSLSVGYGYTSADLTALTTPSGQAVTYGYNSNHQITSIAVNGTTVVTGVTYEPFGGVNGWSWGDGSATSRTFNGDGLVSQIVTAGVTLGYSFDNANRITGISDSSNSALTWSYGYDALDRLTSATTSAITDGWTYDANGNALTQTGTTSISYSITSGSNQLSAATGGLTRSYSYDAAGNTVGYGSLAFSYNDRGRMSVTTGSSTDYLYNALGQMIEKSGTAGTTIFMQDEAGHLIGEYDGSGNLIEETVWLGDIPVATLQPNGSGVNIFYVHTDHLNTPRKIAQPTTGTLAWRWDADPFGTAAPNQNPGGLGTFVYNLRAPGQYYDAETGLSQNWNRDYDPIVGRYIESDPVGLSAGINTYAYVNDEPTSNFDPTGLVSASDEARATGQIPIPQLPTVSPAVKALLCKLIKECAGVMDCVFSHMNALRKQLGWSGSDARQAENFATAAAPNSYQAPQPYMSGAHTSVGVWLYQYLVKPVIYPLFHVPTTPVSDDAYNAGVAGLELYGRPPSDALKWCDGCGNK
jgi:RHS repeat-associated protein